MRIFKKNNKYKYIFNVAENNITYHLQNIFKTNELGQNSVTQKIRVTASDGKKYNTNINVS